MWKLLAVFVVFALSALLLLMKGGNDVDLQGEAAAHAPAASATAEAVSATSK